MGNEIPVWNPLPQIWLRPTLARKINNMLNPKKYFDVTTNTGLKLLSLDLAGNSEWLIHGLGIEDTEMPPLGVFRNGDSLTAKDLEKDLHKRFPNAGISVALRSSNRPSWDAYFMQFASLVATRSTCDRKHVGAVIVRDKRVLSTGYNGSLPGSLHCDDIGHDLVTLADGTVNCVRTVHAEVNAITQAAQFGISVKGATMFTNTFPCWSCMKVILSSGLGGVTYADAYRVDEKVRQAAQLAGVALYQVSVS